MSETPMSAGVSRVYAADFDKTVQAAEDALAASGLDQRADCPPPTPTDVRPTCVPRKVVSMYREESRAGRRGDYSTVILDAIERRLRPQP